MKKQSTSKNKTEQKDINSSSNKEEEIKYQ